MLDEARTAAPRPLRAAPRTAPAGALALLGVVLQICYPLTSGALRDELTVAIVVVLAAACVAHAALTRGIRTAGAVLLATAGIGFAAEILGVHTSVPFGAYSYSGSLGPRAFAVPPLVALAWTMLAWPAALAARRLVRGRGARVALGAWALTAADLFLDPQMVAAGYWHWRDPSTHLPGVPAVALSNLVGWLLVALLLSAVLQRLLDGAPAPTGSADDTVPLALYVWLWAGWSVALAVFLHLPAAAAWGAGGMGTVALPLAVRLRR